MDFTKSIWTFSAASARKIGHPAPFPEESADFLYVLVWRASGKLRRGGYGLLSVNLNYWPALQKRRLPRLP